MQIDVTARKSNAQTVRIDHPKASFGIFCFNDEGDLFVNSDFGFYGHAWRSYGDNGFMSFLAQCNAPYLVDKLESSFSQTAGKRMPKYWKEKLTILVRTFIDYLKTECAQMQKTA